MGIIKKSFDLASENLKLVLTPPLKVSNSLSDLTWKLNDSSLKETKIFWPTTTSWEPATKWFEQIRDALATFVTIENKDIEQLSESTLLIEVQRGKKSEPFIFDISDYMDVDEEKLKHCSLYFKMQFNSLGYADNKIVPAGYLPNSPSIYHYATKLRQISEQPHDYDVYGRFRLNLATKLRSKAVRLLSEQEQFSFVGGGKSIRYSKYIEQAALAKIALDLPGNGPICFRLIDYLAIGSCVLACRHNASLHVELVEGEHLLYFDESLDDLLEACELLLSKPKKRLEMRAASRNFFDKYLHRDQLASYYLSNILSRLE